MKTRSILIITILVLSSCATPPVSTPTSVRTPTAAPLPTSTFTPVPPTATFAPTFTPAPTVPPLPTFSGDPVFIGAGDIVDCFNEWSEKTAAIIEKTQGVVFTTGDNAYDSGSPDQFKNCYDKSWGKFKDRTKPSLGNHDYGTLGASGYFNYFGAVAGDRLKGYYSYDLGAWHIVVVNSNCIERNRCNENSDQVKWLREDLNAHPTKCTLAYWHHPLYTAGSYKGQLQYMQTVWQTLYDAGADVVVNGHDHNYQRYAPQDANGKLDKEKGMREFVVGTGGKDLYNIPQPIANLEAFNIATFGVIKFTLRAASYEWQFIPVDGQTFKDEGKDNCH